VVNGEEGEIDVLEHAIGCEGEGSLSEKMPRLNALICGIFMHFGKIPVRNDTEAA
jgi:hypothetical protein